MRLRRIGRIARWEVTKGAGTLDRKTVFALVVLALLVGVVGVSAFDDGGGLEDGIYVVGVDAESAEGDPYRQVVAASPEFRLEETTITAFRLGESDADVFVGGPRLLESDGSTKGDAAYAAFRDAIERYNYESMLAEPDEAAAFPVTVSVQYQERAPASADGSGSGDASSGGFDGSGAEGGAGSGGAPDGASSGSGEGGGLGIPDVGGGLGERIEAGTPSALSPPFPFGPLILAFLFVVPMNFVIQAYGSTILDERIKRRGELLLVSPASRYEIVAGKTLPYLLGLVAIVVVLAVALEGGVLSVLGALPIALVFLAATFVGAMLARSFKELTFVTVAISVFMTTYTFVPAIFTEVTAIALISPLTIVVMDLQGESVTLGQYLFSTGPFYLVAAVLFLLGIGLYREEDMFAQKAIPAKVVDALVSRLHGYRSVPLLSILFVPFVFVGQLLAVALLFPAPEALALPLLLVFAAAIEELAKSIHVYAGIARSRFDASLRTALVLGVLSGGGFFVGEKLTHAVQFVGLPDLPAGQVVFGQALTSDPLLVLALFLVPLVVHATTATISAIGASYGRTQYAAAFVLATLLHAGYNLGVILLVV
ncbi:ABC transporter permease [Natronobiforma cellulositropha]|uniref:PrsW family intramembrane metalloprotease n=1 Tax=Natronobiforma cellulositropha TaxID=1679076 RepID=UPI0021D5C1D3|nr:PrsW family intramembrane metalloprotease [Natronobiforma cellulositropha]